MTINMHRCLSAAAICGAATLSFLFFLSSAPAAEIKISAGQACAGAGCHEQFGKSKHVHPAMEDGECSACHEQKGDEHAFELAADDNELCYSCHDEFGKKNQHPALEAGCTSCHDPHESDNPRLLIKTPPDICFECHSDLADDFENDETVHAAADDDCLNCHNPHSADSEPLLIEEIPSLCFNCHGDVEDIVAEAAVKHGALERDKRCANCHRPHTSKHSSLLAASGEGLCYTCHDEPIKTDTRELKNMKNWVEVNEYLHGPVAEGNCIACHEPHGSSNFRILKKSYPRRFYSPFSVETYALCFMCHEPNFMLVEETEIATSFRDGSRNLHFVHVNKPVKGRKCTNCHDPHASANPKFIKESSTFGAWEMTLRFKMTETGGSCDPGCHEYRTYDRKIPAPEK